MMYFWDASNQRMLSNPKQLNSREACFNGYINMLCVDTFEQAPKQRYGVYEGIHSGWNHVPLHDFGTAFTSALIQKGVVVPTLRYYAGRLMEEGERIDELEGMYMLLSGQWYHFCHGMNKIAIEDVPKDIRLHAALITGEL